MSERRVEAVVVNWRRPSNVEKIVARLREQTDPCTVTLVECASGSEFALPASVLVDRKHHPLEGA